MRGETQKKVPDYSTVDQKSVSLQQEVLHFLEAKEKSVLPSFQGTGEGAGGRGAEEAEKIQFHS